MPELWLFRGPSGAGKTTAARRRLEILRRASPPAPRPVLLGSDDFFTRKGVYQFVREQLALSHCWNQKRAMLAMLRGHTVLVDNTCTRFWEMRSYVEPAVLLGFSVFFVEPDTPWAFDIEELLRRNTHGTPREVLERMIRDYERHPTVEKVLASREPWNA